MLSKFELVTEDLLEDRQGPDDRSQHLQDILEHVLALLGVWSPFHLVRTQLMSNRFAMQQTQTGQRRIMPSLRTAIVVTACLTTLSGVASAASPTAWTTKDMTAAVKALHYPKPGALKVTCRHVGQAFRCAATYRRKPHTRRFYTEGAALGGWICAGAKLATCKILRHGYITGDPELGALRASRGYMAFRYHDPQPFSPSAPCVQSGQPLTWSFCYGLGTSNVNVTVTLRAAKGGYVSTVGSRLY